MNPFFTVECLPEDLPIRGNAVTSGDPAFDREVEADVEARLENTPWAWCTVKVTLHLGPFKASTYLGACSYNSEAEFRSDPYFEDMCAELRAEAGKAGFVGVLP